MQSQTDVLMQLLSVIALALPALMILSDSLGLTDSDDISSDVELVLSRHSLFSFFLLVIVLFGVSLYLLFSNIAFDICQSSTCNSIVYSIILVSFIASFVPLLYGVGKFLSSKEYFIWQ
ncbi:hypothetical protein AMS69_11350 [Haloarcula rubripromontorii]|uniref:Uncharacterized protein n=1 Tax=Haloarcula rubripromontorii TaxID=1705562 RepID=A0A0M9AK11_9EURY|nr:hypothetical protein [Haloarcula rubripromontorii]KOX93038.1 hypothetical protein AMS69_11350 [Haloarcula rubripromontorii]